MPNLYKIVIRRWLALSGLVQIMAVVYLIPSAFLAYSIAYLIRHPDDWTGPAILGPVSLAGMVALYRFGRRFEKGVRADYADSYRRLRRTAEVLCPIGAFILALLLFFSM